MKNKEFYLKKATLEKYKSIQKVSIDLNPDFNIIIGKNATGKSNFLEFIYRALLFKEKELINSSSDLQFFKTPNNINVLYKIEFKKTDEKISHHVFRDLNVNGHPFKEDIEKYIENLGFFYVNFIKHGIPNNYLFVDKPFSIERTDSRFTEVYSKEITNDNLPYFVRNLIYSLISDLGIHNKSEELTVKKRVNEIINECLDEIKHYLQNITVIQDIRLRNDFNIKIHKNTYETTIHNLCLEFKIGDEWLLFSNLSDGTKRIFYIVSELGFQPKFIVRKNEIILGPQPFKKIILLEEPELGIHPHQLHLLSLFLKERSQTDQIIITTHSPQLLNILNPDELDKIIISSLTDKGTKLRHLSNKEKQKAKDYMENEAYLSDYWTFSDLEK